MTDMLQMKNIIFKLQSDILQRRKQQTTDTDEMNYYEDDEYYEYDGFKTLIYQTKVPCQVLLPVAKTTIRMTYWISLMMMRRHRRMHEARPVTEDVILLLYL